jgi:ribosome-associated protein
MMIASGTSQRHLATLADKIQQSLYANGVGEFSTEGAGQSDWVLVDTFDVIVHLFHPEIRSLYNLEKMWGAVMPERVPAENQIGVFA